jgi:hypothetical protein
MEYCATFTISRSIKRKDKLTQRYLWISSRVRSKKPHVQSMDGSFGEILVFDFASTMTFWISFQKDQLLLFGVESYSSVKRYLKWLDESFCIHLNKISISILITDNWISQLPLLASKVLNRSNGTSHHKRLVYVERLSLENSPLNLCPQCMNLLRKDKFDFCKNTLPSTKFTRSLEFRCRIFGGFWYLPSKSRESSELRLTPDRD